jgi:hypothetical protein
MTNAAAPPMTLSRKSQGSAVSVGGMVATVIAPNVSSRPANPVTHPANLPAYQGCGSVTVSFDRTTR